MLISFDQSSSATGIVVWHKGKPIDWKVIRPTGCKSHVFIEKVRFLKEKIIDFIKTYSFVKNHKIEGINECCFELFVDFIPDNYKKTSVAKLCLFSGYIIAQMENFVGREKVFFVNKGTTPKLHAELVAKSLGMPDGLPDHIYDACFHGFLRNYHKRIKE